MFSLRRVASFFITSGMDGNTLCIAINLNRAMGVDYLYLNAHISIRNTVIMFVFPKVDMVVFSHFMAAVILDLKSVGRQLLQRMFFVRQKLFLPAIVLLLHTGLVVRLYFFFNGLVQGR